MRINVLLMAMLLIFSLGCSDADQASDDYAGDAEAGGQLPDRAQSETVEENYDENLAGAERDHMDDIWYTIEEAQQLAQEEDKYILVDVYTEWCAICHRMEDQTYASEMVQQRLDEYFYPVRLDAESQHTVRFNGREYTEQELALELGVNSYPTAIFIDPQGEPFSMQPGFVESRRFADILAFVGREAYKEQSFNQFQRENQ